MWADPKTCLTVRSSGLLPGRRTQVYCFAPPYVVRLPHYSSQIYLQGFRALTDANLDHLTAKLIISIVYANDVIPTLSLGSALDLRDVVARLCEAEEKNENGSLNERGGGHRVKRLRKI